MPEHNQNPEQQARDKIDKMLDKAGWKVQKKDAIDFNAGLGLAVREYPTDTGPADYVFFVDKKAVGVIEAKREEAGQNITAVEDQTDGYANATLILFLYESTGVITRFTDGRDSKPRSREVFSFHRPETLKEWLQQSNTLRARLQTILELNPDGLRKCQIIAIEKLEKSLVLDKPRALIQMATGAGKTYTAITAYKKPIGHSILLD